MELELFKKRFLFEMEGMKKAKILFHQRLNIAGNRDDAKYVGHQVDTIIEFIERFEKAMDSIDIEKTSKAEIKSTVNVAIKIMKENYQKEFDENMKTREFSKTFIQTKQMEMVEEIEDHFIKYLEAY